MRIHVSGEDTISPQARTYAEYRVFAALSQIADSGRIREARVVLRRARHHRCEGVSCAISVAMEDADALRIRTTGSHAYAAINSAVERLRGGTPDFNLTREFQIEMPG